MSLPIVHHPAFDAHFDETHRFPMSKFSRIAAILVEDGIVGRNGFHLPLPADPAWLALAHAPAYVDQVLGWSVPPAIEKAIGFPVDERVARRAAFATGGTVLAARLALAEGLACNTAGGSHHAARDGGAGFSVFNDVAVAAHVLLAEGAVGRALVFDCDVHQGDGTARIFARESRVFTLSIHGARNYPEVKPPSDLDIPLPDGADDAAYLAVLPFALETGLAEARPDLVFYNAGVDPHAQDRLGRLSLSDAGLAERDRRVIGFFRERGVPVACVIGGGYSRDIETLARRHTILHRVAADLPDAAAARLFAAPAPGVATLAFTGIPCQGRARNLERHDAHGQDPKDLPPGRFEPRPAAAKPTEIPAKGWTEVLWRVYNEISDDRVLLIAAGVTYYLLLAFVPGLSAFLSLYGLVADPATVGQHVGQLQGILPGGALEIIDEQLKRLAAEGRTELGLTLAISLAIALWSANAGVKSLFEAMNVAYDEVETRSFIKLNLVSLGFTLGAIVLMIAMLGVVVVLPAVLGFLGLGGATEWLIRIAGFAGLVVVLSLGVAALYRWGPDRAAAKWRWITPGAILAMLATLVVSALFSWYAANFGSYNATYGSLGALIGFMTWIWLTSTLLIVGAELNSELEHQTARDSTTGPERPLGTRGATMADTVAGGGTGSAPARRQEGGTKPASGQRGRVSFGTLALAVPAALLLSVLQRRSAGKGDPAKPRL